MEVAQFLGPRGCSIMYPWQRLTCPLVRVPSEVLLCPKPPVTARTSRRVCWTRLVRVAHLRDEPGPAGVAGAGRGATSPSQVAEPSGWARRELAVPQPLSPGRSPAGWLLLL